MKNLIGNKIGNVVNLMIDGNAYQKTFGDQQEANNFFKLMQLARSGDKKAYEKMLFELNRKYKTVIKGVLEKDSDNRYYLIGIDIPMPELLAETFVEYLDNDFPVVALSNFWKLLVTNPDERVREDLFKFLQTYNFAITDNGYFIAYKAVEVKESADLDIAAFVSNQYLKIKKWKKNPAHYDVAKVYSLVEEEVENPDYEYYGDIDDEDDENYGEEDNGEPEFITQSKEVVELKLITKESNLDSFPKVEILGNLAEMFKSIDSLVNNRTVYQSKHRGANGKIEQVLGEPVKMDRPATDSDPSVECSSGLHVGSVKYVEQFASANDRILLTLVNPAHVVAVPKYDNSKMRTCEYFPYAELERTEDGKFEVIEQPYFEDDYMRYEASDLENKITELVKKINALKVNEVVPQQMLDYKKILEDRLVSLEQALAE
jgi:hypothetical protein